jgi:hypothetical protein
MRPSMQNPERIRAPSRAIPTCRSLISRCSVPTARHCAMQPCEPGCVGVSVRLPTCRYPTVLRKFHVVVAAALDRAGATSAAKWMTLAVASIIAAASAASMKAGITG